MFIHDGEHIGVGLWGDDQLLPNCVVGGVSPKLKTNFWGSTCFPCCMMLLWVSPTAGIDVLLVRHDLAATIAALWDPKDMLISRDNLAFFMPSMAVVRENCPTIRRLLEDNDTSVFSFCCNSTSYFESCIINAKLGEITPRSLRTNSKASSSRMCSDFMR